MVWSHLSVNRSCQRNNVTAMQDTVMKLYGRVVENKMKDKFVDGCGLSKGARRRGIGRGGSGK